MKTRILSAAALLPLLLVIVLVLPAWATAALFGAAAAIAAYELLYRTGLVKNLRLVCYAMVMAVLVAFWSLRQDANLASIGILVYLAVLLGETLLAHGPVEPATTGLLHRRREYSKLHGRYEGRRPDDPSKHGEWGDRHHKRLH